MHLLPVCHIIVGDYSFTAVNDVIVKRSIYSIGSTAKMKIPATAYFKQAGEPKTAVETAKQFKTGDDIVIKLSYLAYPYNIEFKGFVKRINYAFPVEIECEDWIYWLRRKQIKKSWEPGVTLKKVLNYIISDTHRDIKLSGEVPQITFTGNFPINSNAADALQRIKDEYGLIAYFETDGTLYVGLSYVPDKGVVKYHLGGEQSNVVTAKDLKYRFADDIRLKIKAINIKLDNTRIEAELGDSDGEQRTLYFYNIESKQELEMLAKQEIDKLKFDGYDGKITSMLIPFSEPGMTAEITDPEYPDRSGSYYIESTEVRYGINGARRIVEIGNKMTDG